MKAKGSSTLSTSLVMAHCAAACLALSYAYFISGTTYVKTGVQFVSPLAVILAAHLAWCGWSRGFDPGFAGIVLNRACVTALVLAACALIAAIYAPMPADAADIGSMAGGILVLVVCVGIIIAVIAAAAFLIRATIKAAAWIVGRIVNWLRGPGGGQGGVSDFGALAIVFFMIGVASLEGANDALTFSQRDGASSTVPVAASPERVWRAAGRATSPDFPLPSLLNAIPRPVGVLVDEGVELGARRVVRFEGREGEGDLTLQVTRRTVDEVRFEAVADTSPISMWVRHRALSYRVERSSAGSLLTVSLDYDRLLSPAWFFGPFIRTAATMATGVLARDTKARAEMR